MTDDTHAVAPLTKRDIVISPCWAPPSPKLAKLWPQYRKVARRRKNWPVIWHNSDGDGNPSPWQENAIRAMEDGRP